MLIGALKALTDNSVVNTAQGFGSPDVTTSAMRAAIKEWFGTYFRQEAGDKKDPCMRLAYTIVHKLDKGVFAEYKSDTTPSAQTAGRSARILPRRLTMHSIRAANIRKKNMIGSTTALPENSGGGTAGILCIPSCWASARAHTAMSSCRSIWTTTKKASGTMGSTIH